VRPVPLEECNGKDDDCDGVIDESCVSPVAPELTAAVSLRASDRRLVVKNCPYGSGSTCTFAVADTTTGSVAFIDPVDGVDGFGPDDIDGEYLGWSQFNKVIILNWPARKRYTLFEAETRRPGPVALHGLRAAFTSADQLKILDLQTMTASTVIDSGAVGAVALSKDHVVFFKRSARAPLRERRFVDAARVGGRRGARGVRHRVEDLARGVEVSESGADFEPGAMGRRVRAAFQFCLDG
jgi:hypothetical protein